MAKRPVRRRQFDLRAVRINTKVAAGALATLDVAVGDLTAAAVDPYRLMSIKGSWSWLDISATIDDGFTFGVSHGDYTAAEIEECLEAQGAIDRGDKIALEQSNRLVREIGSIGNIGIGSSASVAFADGRQVKVKLNWYMATGDKLKGWIRNSSDTVWTNGSGLGFAGKMWIKDSV